MKTFALGCAALMMLAATASASDLAVSKSTLGSMGLGSMRTVSDTEGATIRGKFTFATVWGGSSANWFGQSSNNNYASGAAHLGVTPASAGGNSLSGAGVVGFFLVGGGGGGGGGVAFGLGAIGGISGGFANAWAN
jgi:hypothetical protein